MLQNKKTKTKALDNQWWLGGCENLFGTAFFFTSMEEKIYHLKLEKIFPKHCHSSCLLAHKVKHIMVKVSIIVPHI